MDARKRALFEKYRRERFKPGAKAPLSGQYVLTDGTQYTIVRGEPFPPTPRARMTFRLADLTR